MALMSFLSLTPTTSPTPKSQQPIAKTATHSPKPSQALVPAKPTTITHRRYGRWGRPITRDRTPKPKPFKFRVALREIRDAVATAPNTARRLGSYYERWMLARLQRELLSQIELTILGRQLGHGERTLSHLAYALAVDLWLATAKYDVVAPPPFSKTDEKKTVDAGLRWANGTDLPETHRLVEVRQVLRPLVVGVVKAKTLAEAVQCVEDLMWEVPPAQGAARPAPAVVSDTGPGLPLRFLCLVAAERLPLHLPHLPSPAKAIVQHVGSFLRVL